PKHGFSRLDIDAAPELRPLPRDASIVFVVDASYSMTEEGVARELAVARAYLSHVPDAHFEIVAFRRRAERVLRQFAAARQFARLVRRPPLGNGGPLPAGVQAAVEALRDRPGPKRIVVLSDAALRNGFAPSQVGPVPSDIILHVALPEAGSDPEERR